VDPIASVEVSLHQVPPTVPVSDAKVLTGRQRALAHVDLLAATIETRHGARGFGFSDALRAGGAALFAYARDLAPTSSARTRTISAGCGRSSPGPAPRSRAPAFPCRRSPPSMSRCGT
jgi:hypothetical protein